MRTLSGRRGPHHEEEESVFVSMTDMTVSFLFIVMILLAFFASRFNDEETVPLDVFEPVQAERDTLRKLLDQSEERLSAALSQVGILTGERNTLRETLTRTETERDAALDMLALSQKRVGTLERDLDTITAERDVLLVSVATLEDDLAVALARIEVLREALLNAETERDAALEMLVLAQGQVDTLRRDLDATVVERDALLVSIETLEDDLAAALAQIEVLRETLLNAETERDAALEMLVLAQGQVDTLRRDLDTIVMERDALLVSVATLEDDLASALARIEVLREALARAEAERDTAAKKADDRQDRIRELEAEIAALSADLARLRRPDPLKAYLAEVAAQRERVLERLRDALLADFPELEGVITSESDVLRFQGEGLFASGSDALLGTRITIVERIAERLDDLLPCYTLGVRAAYSPECNPAFAVIEAVQIEGHTDSDGADALNVALSARRGAATYAAMTAHQAGLIAHLNLAGQPVLSIAGYGEGRPVIDNATAEGRSTNRRIDLRFIMVTPGESTEIARIRDRLRGEGRP